MKGCFRAFFVLVAIGIILAGVVFALMTYYVTGPEPDAFTFQNATSSKVFISFHRLNGAVKTAVEHSVGPKDKTLINWPKRIDEETIYEFVVYQQKPTKKVKLQTLMWKGSENKSKLVFTKGHQLKWLEMPQKKKSDRLE